MRVKFTLITAITMAIFTIGFSSCTEEFNAEPVDLGLSVLWAPYDLGSTSPAQEGPWYPINKAKFKIPKGWRLPTQSEMDELKAYCTWEESKYGNVNGFLGRGPNGNSIFFAWPDPSAGWRRYMSSTQLSEYNTYGMLTITVEQGPILQYLGGTEAEIRLVKDR